MCTGRELTDNLLKQIEPFGATFHLGQQVNAVERQDDGCFRVETSKGTRFLAKTIFIAGGVGSFQPRRLKVDGLAAFEGTQLFYRVRNPADFAGKNLVIVGGGDSALDWALNLPRTARTGAGHADAPPRRVQGRAGQRRAKMQQLRAAGRMQFIAGQPTGIEARATAASPASRSPRPTATRASLPLDALLVLTGLSPKLGPIAEWGLALERKQLVVDTASFETSTPGIFAVGDVNTYPGKKKLILCGFHEAALAAFGAAAYVFPDRPLHLEYTTTSPRLHRALGVAPAP